MKYANPLTHAQFTVLLRMAAELQSDLPSNWTPDGRTLRGLEARGLVRKFGLTKAGEQLVGEIAGLAQLHPDVREYVFREARKILHLDDELVQ